MFDLFSSFLHQSFTFISGLIGPHIIVVGGFLLALIVVLRLFSERRSPSSTLAWLLFIFFAPYVGVPLYLLLGGRKSRRLVKQKKAISDIVSRVVEGPPCSEKKLTPSLWLKDETGYLGHAFEFFPDGQTCWAGLLQHIEKAKEHIHIATFILGRDWVGKALVHALSKKAAEGVQVRLLMDALGSFWINRSFLKPLIAAGGEVAFFMPMLPLQTQMSSNLRNHRKVAIFDGQFAIVGGQNLDKRFMGNPKNPPTYTDFSAMISGPCVADFNHMFLSDWCFAKKCSVEGFIPLLKQSAQIAGSEAIHMIASGPDMEKDVLWEVLMAAIQNAQKTICIVTPYFLPDIGLIQSLLIKARSGRQVTLIVPKKSNQWLVDVAREGLLRELQKAGATILLHEGAMLHAKLFLVDGALAMMGSANFDLRSLFVNFEVGVFLKSPTSIRVLENWTDALKSHCVPYAVDYKMTPFRKWREDLAHVIAPLL